MKWCAKAPGKVILVGEHFVVHGAYALVAAIDRGVTATAEPSDELVIESESLGLTARLPDAPEQLRPLAAVVERLRAGESGVRIRVASSLPPGSGLGSSAASAVATAAVTAAAWGRVLSREELVEVAMVAERMVHGRPSGIDVAIATYGGVLLFRPGEKPRPISLQGPVELVVGFSGVGRRTGEMIRRFAERAARNPARFRALVAAASNLSLRAAEQLRDGDLEGLGALFNFFHLALGWFGVSSDRLDAMVEAALDAGALGAKLTGAGGGGCVVALPAPGKGEAVRAALERWGPTFLVRLPVRGVEVWRED